MKKTIIFIVILALISGGIWIGRLSTRLDMWIGRTYSQDSPEDVRDLQRLSYLAAPAIAAIDEFKMRNGHYPSSMGVVSMNLPSKYLNNTFSDFGGAYPSFIYYADDKDETYLLYMKLNLEGTLFYQGHGQWTYRQEMDEWNIFP
jgi:hypothetical protein